MASSPSSIPMEMVEKPEAAASPKPPKPAKKKRGALTLVRAALFMMRSDKKVSSMNSDIVVKSGGKGLWQNLICGIRPLHHHGDPIEQCSSLEALPPPPETVVGPAILPPPSPDAYHDVLLPPASPASSVDGMSRYSSAEDLHALDTSEEAGDQQEGEGAGDHAIDMMAEEFIAKFYEQIKLQRMQSMAQSNFSIEKGV